MEFLAQTNLSLTSSGDNEFDDVGSSDKYNFKETKINPQIFHSLF